MLMRKPFLVSSPDPKIERRQKSICFTSLTLSFRLLLAPIRNSPAVKGLAGAFYWLHSFFGSGLGPRLCRIGASFLFLFLSGCASLEVAREVQSGRVAMQLGNPEAAIPHFEAAARLNPDYITDFTLADIGIWTYLGRAYYDANDMGKARDSLRRARDRHGDDDYFARIYLGLVLTQNGARKEGLAEMEQGLKGLQLWLETIPGRDADGQFWDAGHYLTNTAGETLAMLQGEEINWQAIRDNVVWLGDKFDEEIEEVKRDIEFDGDDEDRDDSSVP